MAKIKESIKIKDIDILWYCDDKEGYGVEILSEDTEIADFSFGQDDQINQDIAYEYTFKFYKFICELLAKDLEKGLMFVDKLYTGYRDDYLHSIDTIGTVIGLWVILEDITFK